MTPTIYAIIGAAALWVIGQIAATIIRIKITKAATEGDEREKGIRSEIVKIEGKIDAMMSMIQGWREEMITEYVKKYDCSETMKRAFKQHEDFYATQDKVIEIEAQIKSICETLARMEKEIHALRERK